MPAQPLRTDVARSAPLAAPRPAAITHTPSVFGVLSRGVAALRSAFTPAPDGAPSRAEIGRADAPTLTSRSAPAKSAPSVGQEAGLVDPPRATQPQPQKSGAQSIPPDVGPVAQERPRPTVPARVNVEAWLDSLSLPDRSQKVRLRSALDDLIHGSAVIRRNASAILAGLGMAAEPVLVAYADGASIDVTEACIEILIRIGSDEPSGILRRLAEAPDPAARMVALRVSRSLDSDLQKPILLKALRDPLAVIRRRALTHLAWSHPGWAPAEILRLCYDSDPTVKWAALEALVAMDPKEARGRMDSLYPDMDPLLRRRAVRLIERQAQSQVLGGPMNPTISAAPSRPPNQADDAISMEEDTND